MPTPTFSAVLLIAAGALAVGFLIAWVHFRLRTGAQFVPLAGHRAELLAMRRLYRQRLRAMRDLVARHKSAEQELRSQLRVAESHQGAQGRLLAASQAEISVLRERIRLLGAAVEERDADLAGLRARERELAGQLDEARAKITDSERDHGLLRIERDELVARTQRLRALSMPDSEPAPAQAAPPGSPVAPRAELADRDARIHELECQLRDRESRLAELETSLNTWKYRIAPLALHTKRQRERARDAARAAAIPAPDPPADDLKRIRGIGRGLEKKLHAEGVNRIEQLAGMSPAELANLAVRIGVAASRPQRDRWAEQARELRTNPYVPSMTG